MHIGHRRYVYQSRWYAYHPCPICIPEQVVCISDTDDMHTHLLYAYRTQTICVHIYLYTYCPCPICTPEQVVRISDTDDMCTTCSGAHIVCVQYAYNKCVCISDTDNMHTTCSGTHIVHVRYAYQS